ACRCASFALMWITGKINTPNAIPKELRKTKISEEMWTFPMPQWSKKPAKLKPAAARKNNVSQKQRLDTRLNPNMRSSSSSHGIGTHTMTVSIMKPASAIIPDKKKQNAHRFDKSEISLITKIVLQ